jgi:septum formation protein
MSAGVLQALPAAPRRGQDFGPLLTESRPLLLASASPRRREILTTLGLPIRVAPASVDETVRDGEAPGAYLARITAAKLDAALTLPAATGAGAVLVADTSVIAGGSILGKPADDAEARAMIRALSGVTHEVWTRFAIAAPGPRDRHHARHAETVATKVTFRALDDDEIDRYAASGEGRDKAGGYAVQGLGAFMVVRVDGSYANVVGLPACEVIAALKGLGVLGPFPRRA